VSGTGTLKPVAERWVSTKVGGTVEEILVQVGQRVDAGAAVVTLDNPQLNEAAVQARLALAQANARHRREMVSLAQQRLDGEARIMDARSNYDELRLRLEAQAQLRDKGAVSEIDYESVRIRTEQAKAHWEFEKRRFAELAVALDADREAEEAELAAQQAATEHAEGQLRRLTVRTAISGTVQTVQVELGELVTARGQVAKITDMSALGARIRVQESLAGGVTPGQRVMTSVLGRQIAGNVTRVDPAVVHGRVAMDVSFDDELPSGARPDLSVVATVTVARLEDALFVRRPANARNEGMVRLFRIDAGRGRAVGTDVLTGLGTLKHIEVLQGLEEGDVVVIGDMSPYEGVDEVPLR
ncbi:MAG: HlyD family efflux transporter periplasmic adaptor subunit, partial [Gammaproteobacteria bacterium]|nr:HlyD family efflux transporter periplasmic adaptor subunit [Gammaproteobacteria bacterium]